MLLATALAPIAPIHASSLPGAPACPMFPADSYWHADVSRLPVHPGSNAAIAAAGATAPMHADFGAGLYAGGPIGIPFTTVDQTQPKVPITFQYASESDPGPYPIPPDAPIEGGAASNGDRHVLVVDRDACRLYESFAARPHGGGASWTAGSGAVFDLTSNALRPSTWTSADAAGLPILPGLVRYDEVASGEIDHAIRVTLNHTDDRFIWPARHRAGVNDPAAAPMGAWFRLRADFDMSGFPASDQVILRAMQQHGMIVADNGSSWFISGAPDDRWDNDALHRLNALHGSDFEMVDTSSLVADSNSGRVAGVSAPPTAMTGGYTLDGYGGLHGFAIGAGPLPPMPTGAPYWRGWDIARGVALQAAGGGGFVIDGFGGLHRFKAGPGAGPGMPRGAPYWPGWDIARGVALLPNGTGGYVLDAYGGLHPFGIGMHAPPPPARGAPYWRGWDIARGVVLLPNGMGGYVLDGYGGLHRFAVGSRSGAPATHGATYLTGAPLMRGVTLLPDGTGGYVVDGYGGLHPFAVGAGLVAPPTRAAARWPTWDIARGVAR